MHNYWRNWYAKNKDDDGVIRWIEWFDAMAKLITKIVQVICFAWPALVGAIRKLVMTAGLKLVAAPGLRRSVAAALDDPDEFAGGFETTAVVVGAGMRTFICGLELTHLVAIQYHVPHRIEGLYK